MLLTRKARGGLWKGYRQKVVLPAERRFSTKICHVLCFLLLL